ncbi:MAG: hypothetical protein KGI79_03370 [Patescibacteria group bacterium]|nr:hypothetical protein [Patescibacteria group bacterium]
MTTLSIPVNSELESFINKMIKKGRGSNKADIVRQALERFKDEEAINAILRAQSEPTLKGNLRNLMKKLA